MLDFVINPKTFDPLPAALYFMRVARHPTLSGRRLSPNAGHPDIAPAILVPLVVAGNPNEVALGLIFGRLFGHVRRWLLGHDGAGPGVGFGRIGEGLMNGPPRQRLHSLLVHRGDSVARGGRTG